MENEWILDFLVKKLLRTVILKNVCISLYNSNLHVSYSDRELITYRYASG